MTVKQESSENRTKGEKLQIKFSGKEFFFSVSVRWQDSGRFYKEKFFRGSGS